MSQPLVKTPDTAYIATLAKDGYGDTSISSLNEINCAFFEQFSQDQIANEDLTQSAAYAYLDINNAFFKSLGYQVEGLYFKIAPFGVDQWYVITNIQVAQRKLLTNQVNNVLVNLQVIADPTGGN